LLIVGQRDEAILAMLGVAAVALAAQYAPGGAQVWALTRTPPDSAERRFWEKVQAAAPASIRLAAGGAADNVWPALAAELDRRLADPAQAEQAPPWFLVLHELHKFRELRQEDEFALSLDTDKTGTEPAGVFRRLIEEGPAHGMHVICSCDSVSSLGRFLSRKLQGEFEMRVAFQMSANDSAVLIDSPQANLLGLHRAVLFDGREGILETFRPYALPADAWLEQAASALARRKSHHRPDSESTAA
ncbi:MAG: ATP-binding protein, partial [Verrucomicrobia bacterium]